MNIPAIIYARPSGVSVDWDGAESGPWSIMPQRGAAAYSSVKIAYAHNIPDASKDAVGAQCYWCGVTLENGNGPTRPTIDHVTAKSKRSPIGFVPPVPSSVFADAKRAGVNSVWCCSVCNIKKGDKNIYKWLIEIGWIVE